MKKAPNGSNEKLEAQKELAAEIAYREHVDNSVKLIADLLFGEENNTALLVNVRPAGQPLVDDWDCFKKIVSKKKKKTNLHDLLMMIKDIFYTWFKIAIAVSIAIILRLLWLPKIKRECNCCCDVVVEDIATVILQSQLWLQTAI